MRFHELHTHQQFLSVRHKGILTKLGHSVASCENGTCLLHFQPTMRVDALNVHDVVTLEHDHARMENEGGIYA